MTNYTIRETEEAHQRYVAVDGTMRQSVETARWRLVFLGVVFALCGCIVIGRLTELAVFKHDATPERHVAQDRTANRARQYHRS